MKQERPSRVRWSAWFETLGVQSGHRSTSVIAGHTRDGDAGISIELLKCVWLMS